MIINNYTTIYEDTMNMDIFILEHILRMESLYNESLLETYSRTNINRLYESGDLVKYDANFYNAKNYKKKLKFSEKIKELFMKFIEWVKKIFNKLMEKLFSNKYVLAEILYSKYKKIRKLTDKLVNGYDTISINYDKLKKYKKNGKDVLTEKEKKIYSTRLSDLKIKLTDLDLFDKWTFIDKINDILLGFFTDEESNDNNEFVDAKHILNIFSTLNGAMYYLDSNFFNFYSMFNKLKVNNSINKKILDEYNKFINDQDIINNIITHPDNSYYATTIKMIPKMIHNVEIGYKNTLELMIEILDLYIIELKEIIKFNND